jgi:hypothetical protein
MQKEFAVLRKVKLIILKAFVPLDVLFNANMPLQNKCLREGWRLCLSSVFFAGSECRESDATAMK